MKKIYVAPFVEDVLMESNELLAESFEVYTDAEVDTDAILSRQVPTVDVWGEDEE
jgi:hypothetical protein